MKPLYRGVRRYSAFGCTGNAGTQPRPCAILCDSRWFLPSSACLRADRCAPVSRLPACHCRLVCTLSARCGAEAGGKQPSRIVGIKAQGVSPVRGGVAPGARLFPEQAGPQEGGAREVGG